jgi:hypothetical protein
MPFICIKESWLINKTKTSNNRSGKEKGQYVNGIQAWKNGKILTLESSKSNSDGKNRHNCVYI